LFYQVRFPVVFVLTCFNALGCAGVQSGQLVNDILDRELDIELGIVDRQQGEQLVSSGVVYTLLAATGELEKRADKVKDKRQPSSNKTTGCANAFSGGGTGGSNVRVNQDCSLRRQAEEVVVAKPTNPDNLIAGQNDSRIGLNHCGYDFRFAGGKPWGDHILRSYQL